MGRATRCASSASRSRWSARTSTRIRADPAWPGEEMPRGSLPVVIGRAGGQGRDDAPGRGSSCPATSTSSRPATPRRGRSTRGLARSATVALYGRGVVRHEGRRRGDPRRGPVTRMRAATSQRLDGELLVVLVPSEEDGGQGTLAAIRAGATADMAIITEPSRLDVVVAHAGAITFRLTVPGRAAHASQRREGVSALDNLFVLTRALEADEARRNASETRPAHDGARAAVPDDRRHRRGRRVGVDRARPRRRRRPLRRPARAVAGRRGGRPASGDRGGLRRRPVPARPPRDRRDHRRAVRVGARAVRPPAAGRAGRRGGADHGPAAGAARRAVRRRHADVRQPRRDAVRDLRAGRRPGGARADEHVPLDEVETCARVLVAWVRRELAT